MRQDARVFDARVVVSLNYLLYLPEGYDASSESWPLLLFLHGKGGRGNDLREVAAGGPPERIERGEDYPFIVLSPQCPEDGWWSQNLETMALGALLDEAERHYRIDRDRIYVTGLSMRRAGTWELAWAYPNRFAAIAPICGAGDPAKTGRFTHLPIWAFHGEKDETIPIKRTEMMIEALKAAGAGNVRFTVYADAGHDSWTETYGNPELYEWFLSHTRTSH